MPEKTPPPTEKEVWQEVVIHISLTVHFPIVLAVQESAAIICLAICHAERAITAQPAAKKLLFCNVVLAQS